MNGWSPKECFPAEGHAEALAKAGGEAGRPRVGLMGLWRDGMSCFSPEAKRLQAYRCTTLSDSQ